MNSSEWLNKWAKAELHRDCDIFGDSMMSVRNFVFIWNIFETRVFNKQASANVLFDCKTLVSDVIVDSIYGVIKNRYISQETGEIKDEFNGLFNSEKEDPKHEEEVLRILKTGVKASVEEKNLVCRMVTWRYRCNMFHGEKSAHFLLEDNVLFEPLNMFMIAMIMK